MVIRYGIKTDYDIEQLVRLLKEQMDIKNGGLKGIL
jgi:hypothetical protein